MSHLKKLSLCLATAMFMAMFALALNAQDSMAKQDNTAKKMSATGCLKKGDSANGYYLKGDDGTTYELWGYKDLGKHVDHKVTVTGMEQKMPDAMEKSKEASEKKEAGSGPQMDMKVMHLKMVSETCG